MNITFDKSLKQRFWQMVQKHIQDKHCPFCGKAITGKNFAGTFWLNDEYRAFDGNLICLIQLSDYLKPKKRSRLHIHWFKPIGDWTGYVGIKRCRCGEERTFDIY